ncbi:hypothetical protein OF83DRAFT_646714 [Amylostereum chailletii]|nr:hypothetical protein OF83DRAFT_646714 [Amylostereum chailletii]
MHTPRSTAEPRPTDRAADSTHVAPYLTHVVRHHGQLTLIPPDNAGRVRKAAKREKRPRIERSEEPHFNVGVARTTRRSQPGSPARSRRQVDQERRREEADAGISIPDYPPPSFDEAIASAPLTSTPLALSTPSALNASLSTESTPPEEGQSERSRSRSPPRRDPVLIPPIPTSGGHLDFTSSSLEPASPTPDSRFSSQPNDSDSDKSVELVSIDEISHAASQWEWDRSNGLSVTERMAREQARRQASENHRPPPEPTMQALSPSCSQLTLSPSRADAFDCLNEDELASPSSSAEAPGSDSPARLRKESPPPTRHHKKLTSLFPGVSKAKPAASPPSSPTFASSQLSLPLHFFARPSSPSKISPPRSEGFGPKRLFTHTHKGKEKSVDVPSPGNEALESWEMLETSPSDDESFASVASSQPSDLVQRKVEHHAGASEVSTSIRQGVENALLTKRHSLHDRPVPPPVPPSSQPRRRPPPPPPIVAPPPSHPPSSSPTRACQDENATSSGDLTPTKNRTSSPLGKLKFSTSMIWSRTRRIPTSPTSPTSPATPNPHPTPPSTLSPVTLGQTSINSSPPPLAETIAPHADRSGNGASHHDQTQRVISPLRHSPTSPSLLESSRHESFDGIQTILTRDRTTSNTVEVRPPLRQVPPSPSVGALNAVLARPLHARTNSQPQLSLPMALTQSAVPCRPFAPSTPSPLSIPSFTNDTAARLSVSTTSEEESLIDLYDHSPVPTHASMSIASMTPTQPPPSPQSSDAGGHYTGRPLPRPPGSSSDTVIQPTPIDVFIARGEDAEVPPKYVDEDKHMDISSPKASSGPPRAFDMREASNSSTTMGHVAPPVQVSFTVNLASPSIQNDQVSRSTSSITLQDRPGGARNPSFTPSRSDSLSSQTTTPVSEYQAPGGSVPNPTVYSDLTDLDVLLSRLEDGNSTGSNYEELLLVGDILGRIAPQGITPRAPSPPVGYIEVTRRRVTKDGRVKLKLSLLGVSVDRCGICLSQFKDSESASLLPKCQHAFHEKCISAWLRRGNRACPMCRESLA